MQDKVVFLLRMLHRKREINRGTTDRVVRTAFFAGNVDVRAKQCPAHGQRTRYDQYSLLLFTFICRINNCNLLYDSLLDRSLIDFLSDRFQLLKSLIDINKTNICHFVGSFLSFSERFVSNARIPTIHSGARISFQF